MNRQELINQSETYIRKVLKEHLPPQTRVYLYGSRARHDNRWNSDYDLWIDTDLPHEVIAGMREQLEESFVPFKIDIVTTPQLKGEFAAQTKRDAIQWM